MNFQTPYRRPSNASQADAAYECERPSNALQTPFKRQENRTIHTHGFKRPSNGNAPRVRTPFKRPTNTHPHTPIGSGRRL
jgi:hypothetical protein